MRSKNGNVRGISGILLMKKLAKAVNFAYKTPPFVLYGCKNGGV
jgi:hypothetical protein